MQGLLITCVPPHPRYPGHTGRVTGEGALLPQNSHLQPYPFRPPPCVESQIHPLNTVGPLPSPQPDRKQHTNGGGHNKVSINIFIRGN